MKSSQSEQAERKRLAGSTSATTFHALANLDYSLGGRFSAGGSVSGSEEGTDYPRLPADSPWSADPTGVEPPLNYRVDDLEPTGEPHEIEIAAASLAESVGGEDAAGLADAPSGSRVEHSEASSPRTLLSLMEAKR
jgi:hypothetical protein